MTAASPRRVLVVEDEYLLADDLTKVLDREGAIVVGPVATEADALVLLEGGEIDCAILDINLHGRMVYPLARALRRRDVPFLFVTGYDSAEAEEDFGDVQLLRKPVTTEAVLEGIGRLTRR